MREALPSKTLASRRDKTAPGYKERVKILTCANATGDHKLLIMTEKLHAPKDLNLRT